MVDIPDAERSALHAMTGHVMRIARGTALPIASTVATSMFAMIDGFVGEIHQFRDGRRQIVAIYLPGDTLYLRHAAGRIDPVFPLVALTDCCIATFDARQIEEECPTIASSLATTEAVRARTMREWLVDAGRRSALEATAHRICEFHVRQRLAGLSDGDRIAFPLSQTDLADALDLTIVTVNRTLTALRNEGLIATRRGEIDVLDPGGLRRLSRFDDGYLLP